jgi:hypothetical protein
MLLEHIALSFAGGTEEVISSSEKRHREQALDIILGSLRLEVWNSLRELCI